MDRQRNASQNLRSGPFASEFTDSATAIVTIGIGGGSGDVEILDLKQGSGHEVSLIG